MANGPAVPDLWPLEVPEKSKLCKIDDYDGSKGQYKTWLGDIKIELQNHDLAHHMTNKGPPPQGSSAQDASAELKAHAAARAGRLINKRKVYTFIYKSLPRSLRADLQEDPYNGNPYLTLLYVEQKCHQVSKVTIEEIEEKLLAFRQTYEETLKGTTGRLGALVNQLRSQSVRMADKERRRILM
jgi:hypothetical protein